MEALIWFGAIQILGCFMFLIWAECYAATPKTMKNGKVYRVNQSIGRVTMLQDIVCYSDTTKE